MRNKFFAASLSFLFIGCAAPAAKSSVPVEKLDSFLEHQERRSFDLLKKNISPSEPAKPGGPRPLPGVIVAGLSKVDPNYYYHWIRDSSEVMTALISSEGQTHRAWLENLFTDFLRLSARLQKQPSKVVQPLGEPRYTVSGETDQSPWSRPQYDGPALRALAVMKYLDWGGDKVGPENLKLALKIVRTDLAFVAKVHREYGFDIWEEFRGDNYNVRVSQLSALERGRRYYDGNEVERAIADLRSDLDKHWDGQKGYLRSQTFVQRTDGSTTKPLSTDLDSAVIVSLLDADLREEKHSVMDPRAQATVKKLSDVFRAIYPINQKPGEGVGLAFGRYKGDGYFGGNPWPLITAYYAQFYYRVALSLLKGEPLKVEQINVAFVNDVLPASDAFSPQDVTSGAITLAKGQKKFRALVHALTKRGDEILRRVQLSATDDGDFFEQIDKNSGSPVSSRGLAWAHAAFLSANAERQVLQNEIDKQNM